MLILARLSQVSSNDPVIVLRVLQEQQASLTAELAAAQQQLRAAQVKLDASTGANHEEARAMLEQADAQASDARRRLNMVRDRVLDAQRDVGVTTTSTAVAVGQEQSRIFNLKPAEFYSAMGFVLWFPVMLAFARRIWRSSPSRPRRDEAGEGSPQINRLEQAVEAIAIEVERISEAQRFSAKLLAERAVEPVSEQAATPRRAKRPVITPLP
jgi:multidrug efflux pump subunit AcrA (membrane-fusion protein)